MGNVIPRDQQAHKAAEFLANKLWNKPELQNELSTEHVINDDLKFDTSPFCYGELHEVLVKLKRRKTPGPDEFLNEAIKEMNREQAEQLRMLLNEWLSNEHIEQETLKPGAF